MNEPTITSVPRLEVKIAIMLVSWLFTNPERLLAGNVRDDKLYLPMRGPVVFTGPTAKVYTPPLVLKPVGTKFKGVAVDGLGSPPTRLISTTDEELRTLANENGFVEEGF